MVGHSEYACSDAGTTRAPSGDPGDDDPAYAPARADEWVSDRQSHRAHVRRAASGGPQLAVSGPAPPGAQGLGGIEVGGLGHEAARQIVPAYRGGAETTAGRAVEMGAAHRRHRSRDAAPSRGAVNVWMVPPQASEFSGDR